MRPLVAVRAGLSSEGNICHSLVRSAIRVLRPSYQLPQNTKEAGGLVATIEGLFVAPERLYISRQ